jgi:hypothetical protein
LRNEADGAKDQQDVTLICLQRLGAAAGALLPQLTDPMQSRVTGTLASLAKASSECSKAGFQAVGQTCRKSC